MDANYHCLQTPRFRVLSDGQIERIFLATLECLNRTGVEVRNAEARDLLPIFLLDDVSSELDPDRSQALFDHLATARCQIFLTTTRRDLVIAPNVSPDRGC